MCKNLRIVLGKILIKERKETPNYLFVIFEFYNSRKFSYFIYIQCIIKLNLLMVFTNILSNKKNPVSK